MHRKLMTLLFLCLCVMTRGQALYDYRYWFDGDESTMQTGSSADNAWQMDLDIGALDANFHIVHFQVKDTKGVWSVPTTRYFVKLAQKQVTNIEYWFDNDTEKKSQLAKDGKADIDVSSLAEGMHILHMQAFGEGSSYSSPHTAVFWKQIITANAKYRLWFDNDINGIITGKYTGKPVTIDVSSLDDGFHILHAQVESVSPSQPLTSMFIKVPQTQDVDYMTCAFMVDGEMYKQEKVSTHGGLVSWVLDAADMKPGLHKAQAFVVTPSGAATGLKETSFYRSMTDTERKNMKCLYSVDGSEHYTEAGKLNGNLFHFDLDVANLTDGFHNLSYMLMGEDGTSSKVMSTYFYKTVAGGNGITQYDYWLNDNESNRQIVKLDKKTNPLQVITLLPVEQMPVRSSSFKFEISNDGTPVIYAKNDFHVRFCDASGRLTESLRSFVDYRSSIEIRDIDNITDAEGSINADIPNKNGILWYSLEANIGDSIAVKGNRASTLQIFSPAGKELYSTSGSESMLFGGCHAYEKGTYYIAQHDIAGTIGNTVNLDYQHIDKYAVLKYSPGKLGKANSRFDLNLIGNGMDKLKRVEIRRNGRIVLASEKIKNVSLSYADITFERTDTVSMSGKYDIVLTFNDGKEEDILAAANAIEFEETFDNGVEAVFESTRTLAYPYPVKLKLKNNSNVEKKNLQIVFGYDNTERIFDIVYNNFKLSLPDGTEFNSVSQLYYRDSLLNLNKVNMMIPYIAPYEEAVLQFGIDAPGHTLLNLYATVLPCIPQDSIDAHTKKDNLDTHAKNILRAALKGQDNCTFQWTRYGNGCMHMWMHCPQGESVGGLAYAGHGESAGSIGYTGGGESAGSIGRTNQGDSPFMGGESAGSIANGNGTILTALSTNNTIHAKPIARTVYKGNGVYCPDPPKKHPVETLVPGDPNDIFGYKSEADTTFVRKDFKDLYYTIEFENSPELATASAHTIVVRDTLDGKLFDLSTYEPTSLKIGNVLTELSGEKTFVKTVDLRPAINVIAEVNATYDEKKGIAVWTISSLDPMTMEPTDNPMSGVLPINNNGDGQGEISFNIKLNDGLDDGTEINNRASIVFDREDAILTPVWTNTVDAVAPESKITFAANTANDITLRFDANDNRSGVWKYNLYVQEVKDGKWTKVEDEITTSEYTFKGIEGFDYGFCVMAVDSAGNVEQKELAREISISTFKAGDANSDGIVDAEDASLATNYYLGRKVYLNFAATDINKDEIIDSQDVAQIQKVFLSTKARSRVKNRKRIQ